MVIIEDTRQKTDKHRMKHLWFACAGIPLIRCALPFGDYAYPPPISVDTKENMSEIAANISTDHSRFRNECVNAAAAGCHLYILVENKDGISSVDDVHKWINPNLEYRPKSITGDRLEKSMKTMTRKYGVTFMFCDPRDSADMIVRILDGEFE